MVMETVPDLFWPTSVRTYARMRHDTQLAAILKAYSLPIRRASWAIDGSNCRPEVTAFIADEMGLPIIGQQQQPSGHRRRRFQWHEHLRLSLLDLTFGHMAFERIYDTSGPLTRIANVYERMPQTIYQIHLGKDGSLQGIQQHFNMDPEQPVIEANALVWYANEREGTNYVGQSLLRPAWAWWLLKHEVARVHATSIRRFGMGVPQVTAPPGASPQQVAEAQRLASSIRVGDQTGVGLPQGFQLALQGLVGSVPDSVAFIEYLDKQMTRSTLTSVLDLADTTHGSRALGETFLDLFILALQSYADAKAQQGTDQLVVPLVDLNWGEDEPCPRIVCGDVGAQHEVTAQTMMLLVESGAISPDPALEEYLRREYKLPDRSIPWVPPAQRGLQGPQADPNSGLPANDPTGADQGNVAASAGGFTGAYIMAKVHPDDAARLTVKGGESPDSMHVTLGFLAKPAADYDQATRAKLEAALGAIYPGAIGADAFAVATFNSENKPTDDHPPCTVLLVQSAALASLHDAVSDVIDAVTGVEEAGTFPIWTPHVTLGYGITPADVPPGRLGKIMFDRLVIGWGDKEVDVSGVAAKASEVRAAPAGQFPRQPTPHEVAAQTDFAAIQAALAAAVAALVTAWASITAAWRTQVTQQITSAAAANDVTALGSLTLDTAAAKDLLANGMQDFAQKAAVRQMQEAAAQGVSIPVGTVDAQRIDALAQAFADQLANAFEQAAARAALAAWGDPVPSSEVVARVDQALADLSEKSTADTLGGPLHVAQNEGRTATLQADPGTVKAFYAASEIMDKNTCEPCRSVDGKLFPDLAAAKAAYPFGGFIDCQGRLRCRGIITTVWSDELDLAA